MAKRTKDPYEFLRSQTFDFWHNILEFLDDHSTPEARGVIGILAHIAKTSDEWIAVKMMYEDAGLPRKGAWAGRRAAANARQFHDWYIVLYNAVPSDPYFQRALTESRRLATSFKDLLMRAQALWVDSSCRSYLPGVARDLMKEAKTFDDWFDLWESSSRYTKRIQQRIERGVEAKATTDEHRSRIAQRRRQAEERQAMAARYRGR